MMPDINREERRKKRVPVIGFILVGTLVVSVLLQLLRPGWEWVPLAVGTVAVTAVGVSIDPPIGRGRGSRRRGGGLSALGRADDDRAVGTTAHRWRVLVLASRLMPRPAGRRWLAEAESLLSEITAARRAAAIRSYLLSTPRLAVMMWASAMLRRVHPPRGTRGNSRLPGGSDPGTAHLTGTDAEVAACDALDQPDRRVTARILLVASRAATLYDSASVG
jgi:hypothetical protein